MTDPGPRTLATTEVNLESRPYHEKRFFCVLQHFVAVPRHRYYKELFSSC